MSECIEFTNMTPLYEITQKDILKILKERLYQVRKSDIKKSKRNSAKGGHVMWYRVGINKDGEEVPQGILLSSSSGTIAWKNN